MACATTSNIARGGAANQLPASRRRNRIHAGLLAGDAHRSGRHALTWHAVTRRGNQTGRRGPCKQIRARIQACRRGRFAPCVAAITSSGVQPAHSATRREVWSSVAAVAHRDLHDIGPMSSAGRCSSRCASSPMTRSSAARSVSSGSKCTPIEQYAGTTSLHRHRRRWRSRRAELDDAIVDERIDPLLELDEQHRVAGRADVDHNASSSLR